MQFTVPEKPEKTEKPPTSSTKLPEFAERMKSQFTVPEKPEKTEKTEKPPTSSTKLPEFAERMKSQLMEHVNQASETSDIKVEDGAAIFLSGVMTYMIEEVVELAGNKASDDRKCYTDERVPRIEPRHLASAVNDDEELCRLVKGFAGPLIPKILDALPVKAAPRGLFYYPNAVDPFLTRRVEKFLMSKEFQSKMFPVGSSKNSRKVMHYGFSYNYKSGGIAEPAEEFPDIINYLRDSISRIYDPDFESDSLNQCIINRYLPGQGISAHIDRKEYGDVIACFTFLSGREMMFERWEERPEGGSRYIRKYPVYTQPGSLYVMTDEARNEFEHSMPARKSDILDGERVRREDCYSITFRRVPVEDKDEQKDEGDTDHTQGNDTQGDDTQGNDTQGDDTQGDDEPIITSIDDDSDTVDTSIHRLRCSNSLPPPPGGSRQSPQSPPMKGFSYKNSLGREYSQEKIYYFVTFDISRYGEHTTTLKFDVPQSEADLVAVAEKYLSQEMTGGYFDMIQDDQIEDDFADHLRIRGDALGSAAFVEELIPTAQGTAGLGISIITGS